MRLLLMCLLLAACGLPDDIVGPVDYGNYPPDPNARCPVPEEGSDIESPGPRR